MKLSGIIKIIFIICLLVRSYIYQLPPQYAAISPQVVFVLTLFLPSVQRFLAEEVLVIVSTEPRSRDGQIRVEPLSPPAVTFCASQDVL